MLLEDRFAIVGVQALGATVIPMCAWAMAPEPYTLQFCALTWICIMLSVACLTGTWAVWMGRHFGGYAWSVIRHHACTRGIHLARSRRIVLGIKECGYCSRRFK